MGQVRTEPVSWAEKMGFSTNLSESAACKTQIRSSKVQGALVRGGTWCRFTHFRRRAEPYGEDQELPYGTTRDTQR